MNSFYSLLHKLRDESDIMFAERKHGVYCYWQYW